MARVRGRRAVAVLVGGVTAALLATDLAPAREAAPTPPAAHATSDQHAGSPHRTAYPEVQRALEEMVAAGAPGVLARVDDGEQHWVGTSGVADLESGEPVPREGRFRVASITKSVVSTVVLQLVGEGRLSLDEPVATWLPDAVTHADRITVRQLLHHTSGLGDYLHHTEFADPEVHGQRTYRPQQLLHYAEEAGRVGEPGEKFAYSNAGYVLLGLLVEEVTGNELGAEISRRVLRPAGMTRSYLPLTEVRIHGPHATGYYLPEGADPDQPSALREITELNPSFAWAAYGLVSDARDINRFFGALFGGRLVPKELLDEMRQGVGTPQAPVFPEYGLGLESTGLTCGVRWGATGSIPGYQTYAFADGSGERRITISVNVHRTDPGAGRLILAGVNALNQFFCGAPYPGPSA